MLTKLNWRLTLIALGVLVVSVPSAMLFFRSDSPQNIPRLTVAETVGLAFYAGVPPCVKRGANPEARHTFFRMLTQSSLVDFHLGAANSLGYVCSDGDIQLIEEEIARRAAVAVPHSGFGSDKSVVRALCMALAIMDLRGVKAAAPALRRMSTEEFWNERGAVYFRSGSGAVLTDADVFRANAIEAYAFTGRGDVSGVVQGALAGLAGERRRLLEDSIQSKVRSAQEAAGFFERTCDQKAQEEWLQSLRKCWNNDLDDPQPTSLRSFPRDC